MELYISDEVKQLGVKCVGVVIEGVDNHTITQEYLDYRKNTITKLVEKYEGKNIKTDPIIEGFYLLHEKVNVKRRKNPPASELLIKLLIKNKDLHSINKVVDLYNLLSIDTKLALGAHDIDKIEGNVSLRLTLGNERFVPLGKEEPQPVQAGEYSYIDDKEIICRLEMKQIEKTKVTQDSKNIFFIVQGNENTSDEYVKECAFQLIKLITAYCGGYGFIL